MHIPDGILTSTASNVGMIIIGTGWVVAGTGITVALRKLDEHRIPMVAMLSSAFFIVTLVQIPTFFGPVHLLLCGLLGVMLGWLIFPAVFVALLLEYFFFSCGGLTTLGINTATMALPGLVCHLLFRRGICSPNRTITIVSAAMAAFFGVLMAIMLYVACFLVTDKNIGKLALATAGVHVPVLVVETIITPMIVLAIKKIRPDLFSIAR
ncbi:MAG: CbiM family transporter [Planctomycetaceae bacterium]|nr:CbiM family transporter [Planctomycetaceae bacterium]